MESWRKIAFAGILGACQLAVPLSAQPAKSGFAQLTESGNIVVAGRSTPYLIRHLPVSSFPELPASIVDLLNRRGCTIPQTYEAHRPENVVHASLEGAGSSDWAVLCSAQGTVSLLVFFVGDAGQTEATPTVLASSPETERLQAHDPSGVLGFNWGIDPATPQQVHEAQSGLKHRPALVDHDALADSTVEHRTIYHFYAKSNWFLLDTQD
ncbi:MAG: hypothetical protein ABR987_02115 [Terracidiphilus sp.]|jgi:hypothetical protein